MVIGPELVFSLNKWLHSIGLDLIEVITCWNVLSLCPGHYGLVELEPFFLILLYSSLTQEVKA